MNIYLGGIEKFIMLLLSKKVPVKPAANAATDGGTIYLPPQQLDEEGKLVYLGKALHESAHIKYESDFTHFRRIQIEHKHGALMARLINITDDIRIEHAMQREFPRVVETTRPYWLWKQDNILPDFDKAVSMSDLITTICNVGVLFIARCRFEQLGLTMTYRPSDFISVVYDNYFKDLEDEAHKLVTYRDSVKLAEKLYERIKDMIRDDIVPPMPPQQSQDNNEDDDQQPGQPSTQQSGSSKSQGEKDDDDGDNNDEDDSQGGGSSDEKEPTDSDESSGNDSRDTRDSGQTPDDSDEGEESPEKDASDGSSEDTSDTGEEDSGGDGEEEDSDEPEESSSGNETDDDSESEDEESEESSGDTDGDEEDSGEPEEEEDSPTEEEVNEQIEKSLDGANDGSGDIETPDEAVTAKINHDFEDHGDEYVVSPYCKDVIRKGTEGDSYTAQHIKQSGIAMLGKDGRNMIRAFVNQTKPRKIRRQEYGRFDATTFIQNRHSIDVFTDSTRGSLEKAAIAIALDNSSSMRGHRAMIASQLLSGLLHYTDRGGVPTMAAGYTTTRFLRDPSAVARDMPVHIDIIKSFEERYNASVKRRCCPLPNHMRGATPDLDCIKWITPQLMQRKEKKKVLLVVCDGEPYLGETPATGRLRENYKKYIQACKDAGICVFGFGIEEDISDYFGDDWVYVTAQSLADNFMAKLSKILNKRR
jgi:cobalamin biosynthesis protein CobT